MSNIFFLFLSLKSYEGIKLMSSSSCSPEWVNNDSKPRGKAAVFVTQSWIFLRHSLRRITTGVSAFKDSFAAGYLGEVYDFLETRFPTRNPWAFSRLTRDEGNLRESLSHQYYQSSESGWFTHFLACETTSDDVLESSMWLTNLLSSPSPFILALFFIFMCSNAWKGAGVLLHGVTRHLGW